MRLEFKRVAPQAFVPVVGNKVFHAKASTSTQRQRVETPASSTPVDVKQAVAEALQRGEIKALLPGEDVEGYIARTGLPALDAYRTVLGMANPMKEGDGAIGVMAADAVSRERARALILATPLHYFSEHAVLSDDLGRLVAAPPDAAQYACIRDWTVGKLKSELLQGDEARIKAIRSGLSSDVIAALVKTMSDDELVAVCAKIHDVLPGSMVGAPGVLSARIQPNSPTDDPEDIQWQVFNGLSWGLNLLLLGTNPVDGTVESVAKVEAALQDIVKTFQLEQQLPWSVLAHADAQMELRQTRPDLVPLMFQSISGTDATNQTFGIDIQKMERYASSGVPGLYFETGQGSEFTNRGSSGVDMVSLESRKYGLARHLRNELEQVHPERPWMHVNDVSGFIGPEVFKSKEQLVRVMLEDLTMGKLHGVTMGLDVCATLHMGISLDELKEAQDRIIQAAPAYMMALPNPNDPMLSYLTTSFQDHVRLRMQNGLTIAPEWKKFYQSIGIINDDGTLSAHAGDPLWVYVQYRQRKGDKRPQADIEAEGRDAMARVKSHGINLAVGHGKNIWDLEPALDARVRALYEQAKISLAAEFTPQFVAGLGQPVELSTNATGRQDYISNPTHGERLSEASEAAVKALKASYGKKLPNVQFVISDGLNADALMDSGHLQPFLTGFRQQLEAAGLTMSLEPIVIRGGRVRAGYEVGKLLFDEADDAQHRAIVHIIGERPGTEHNNYSVYITSPVGSRWRAGTIDHDITKVVSGISDTALHPDAAAGEAAALLFQLNSAQA